jgi:hypothetical protein
MASDGKGGESHLHSFVLLYLVLGLGSHGV